MPKPRRKNAGVPVLIICCLFSSASIRADGIESVGNADGVLTWELGSLEPGGKATVSVFLAYSASYKVLVELKEGLLKEAAAFQKIGNDTQDAEPAPIVWISNAATDFALHSDGSFFWEGNRQSLRCERGGQLSRFGYSLNYDDGSARRAGVSVTKQGARENMEIVRPMGKASDCAASGVLQTQDGCLRVNISSFMTAKTAAVVRFEIENSGGRTLKGARLSTYANLEAAHDHENDFATLDSRAEALLTLDPGTGMCAAMFGDLRPVSGYCGTWPSEKQLQEGSGIAFAQWKPFNGLDPALISRMGRSLIPHPPAPYVVPDEPATKDLSDGEAKAQIESDWLFQAGGEPLHKRAMKEIAWSRELADRIGRIPDCADMSGEIKRLNELEDQVLTISATQPDANVAREAYFSVRRVKRDIAFKNPALDFKQVLFIDNPYTQGAEWPHEARHRNGMMAVPGGRLLVLDGLHPGGKLRKLAPEKPGSFWRPDLSFGADKVLFCFKPHDEKSFHLYETGLDGGGLKQLTSGDYDDLDPIYLPDGRIMFSTTRCNTYIRCMPYTYAYVLARCAGDGSEIYLLSQGNEPDYLPALLDDGRVIYTRWEYTDKALWRIQSLWTVNPDGTNVSVYWGNQSVWPDMLIEPRQIPGTKKIMFTGSAHHNWYDGSVGIIDPDRGFNFPHGLTKVTADVPWPECGEPPIDPVESPRYHVSGAYDAYKTPYPIGERDFLVSARSGGKFRLYLMDIDGNRELIYEGAHHVLHALPVKPRNRPIVQPDTVAWPGTGSDRKETQPGVMYSADVCQGVPDMPRSAVKYLRVFQMDPRTYSTWTRDIEPNQFCGPVVSILQADGVKRILGTVPVEADGSVSFKVPAGKALHFQLLDENQRAIHTMRSFTGVMPGEKRGCVGCHEMHSVAPVNKPAQAAKDAPRDLEIPPWGTASIRYETFVQPALDKHCAACHQGNGKARKKLDLTLRPGAGVFKEPYVTLVTKGIAGAIMVESYAQSDPKSYATFRPMKYLSSDSMLIRNASSGKHNGVKVGGEELMRLIAWVDANCPYRGEEDIRAIPDPQFAGIEWLPVRPLCKSAPEIPRP
ncbi:MAG TPA: hypothetical protein PL033_05335 [Candidatus Brocadiia bacterium]|nr:hypothetical protein [Candidatus Brocadiia bacterium]